MQQTENSQAVRLVNGMAAVPSFLRSTEGRIEGYYIDESGKHHPAWWDHKSKKNLTPGHPHLDWKVPHEFVNEDGSSHSAVQPAPDPEPAPELDPEPLPKPDTRLPPEPDQDMLHVAVIEVVSQDAQGTVFRSLQTGFLTIEDDGTLALDWVFQAGEGLSRNLHIDPEQVVSIRTFQVPKLTRQRFTF